MKNVFSVLVLLAVLGCASSLKPGEIIKKNFSGEIIDDSKRSVVIILPFRDLSDQKKYPASRQIGQILYNGIYNVIGYIPSFDVPDKRLMNGPAGKTNGTNHADFIISAEYGLKGTSQDPDAAVRLTVWSRITGEVFTNDIKTKTDADIFDAVDTMISRIISVTLKEEARFAQLSLDGFQVGRERYDIYVNRKFLATVTNDHFSLGLKVLPDRPYQVAIVRLTDLKEVLNAKVSLSPSGATNIGYSALGKIRYELVDQKPSEPYRVFLDGKDVTGTQEISAIEAGRTHVLRKLNIQRQNSYQTRFLLRDGEIKQIPLYNLDSDLYDLDKDSCFMQFERILNVVTNPGGIMTNQVPMTSVIKGNISGVTKQLNGFISDRTESNTVHFWAQREQVNDPFKVIIADRDNELFVFTDRDGWGGPKKYDVPFSGFKPYVWQQSEDLNGEIDYPITSIYFRTDRQTISVMGIYFNENKQFNPR